MSEVHLLEHDERAEGIAKAAWQLEDAIKDRLVEEYPSDLQARKIHFEVCDADIDFGRALKAIILLTIFETPSWCNTEDHFWSYMDSSERCSIKGVESENVLLSNLPYLPPGWTVIIELVLMVFVFRKIILERKLQTWYFKPLQAANGKEYFSMTVNNFGLCMVALNLFDLVIFCAFRPNWRLAFIARSGYLATLPAVRNLFTCIIQVVDEFYSIASFLVCTVVFFAWIAVTIFDDMHDEIYGAPVNVGLDTLRNTVYTMFVAGTTDDFISCFLPSYTMYRWSGILWFVFLIIVQVLLLNLVLDTLVAAYTSHSEETSEEIVEGKTLGVMTAYKTLTEACGDTQGVSKETFMDFVAEFSSSPSMRTISPMNAEVIFQAIDDDNSGFVEEKEFLDICKVIEYEFWTTEKDSPVKKFFPAIWNNSTFKWFREKVELKQFDSFMNYVLLVNLLLVVNESRYDLYGWSETVLMENLELVFSFIYVMEVGLMLSVYSFGEYWSARSNQFDFFTTWLLLASSILDELASSSAGSNVKRYMNILRLLRLLRVIKQLKRQRAVQFMVSTISTLVTASKDILSLLFIVVFFFASLSVQLWGGLLYIGNPLLEETEYKEKNFFVLNFNDFGMSVGVWWVSLLCEYIRCFPDAIWLVSPLPFTWWVFPIFYVCGVSIIFELVKAFTIEMFIQLSEAENEKLEEEKEKKKEKEKQKLEGKEIEDENDEEDDGGFNKSVIKSFNDKGLELHYRIVGDISVHAEMQKAFEEILHKKREEEEGQEGTHHGHDGHHGNPQAD